MAGFEEVRRIALQLPEAQERPLHGQASWRVRDKLFVWERPLSAREREELGDEAPEGPVLGARVEHEIAKEAMLAEDPRVFFTTSHFRGSAAILVRLERIGLADLEEVIREAWLCRAPKALAKAYLQEHGLR